MTEKLLSSALGTTPAQGRLVGPPEWRHPLTASHLYNTIFQFPIVVSIQYSYVGFVPKDYHWLREIMVCGRPSDKLVLLDHRQQRLGRRSHTLYS